MAFISGYEYIFKNEFGEIFNFYLNEQKHIEYIVSNNKGKWQEKHLVIPEATENFHIDVDNKNNIHIISFHSNGNLYYSHFNNKSWENQLIVQYPIEDQKIFYPVIKYINNEIHIFYYLVNLKDKSNAFLLYLNFNNKDYKTNHIATVHYKSYINPFKVFLVNDYIVLLYGSSVEGFDHIFINKLNITTKKWDNPICISNSKDRKLYIDGLIDKNKNLHIIWSKYDEEYLTINYLNLDLTKSDIKTNNLEPIPLSSESSCSFPNLIYYKDILWATWTEMNKVISVYSTDSGKIWSKPFIHEDTRKTDFKRYRFISNSSNYKSNIFCDFVFGTLYPNIQFLGFGGETDDDIPTS